MWCANQFACFTLLISRYHSEKVGGLKIFHIDIVVLRKGSWAMILEINSAEYRLNFMRNLAILQIDCEIINN